MKPAVYIETSVVSYLTARRSHDIRIAFQQNITADWWELRRHDFELFVSEFVITEAARGNEEAAAKRLAIIQEMTELETSDAATVLASALIDKGSLPAKAQIDAFHIAVAATHGLDFLLTWNCKHIANAVMRPEIERICREMGFEPPVICTPNELLEPIVCG
ncbi:MAG: type II toxin-antitoxin system VapC family toxin [Pseudomonadota bacterium]